MNLPRLNDIWRDAEPSFEVQTARVELVTDSHRLTGELRYAGLPRRLVDVLNSFDGAALTLVDGSIEAMDGQSEAPHRFHVAQVRRDGVLFALPRDGGPPHSASVEAVRKAPVLVTMGLPGYEITGHVYLPAGANPETASLLSSRQFVPVTDAVIAPSGGGTPMREPLVLVNLARTLVYAPEPRRV